jgi:hypothetical protein
LKDSTLFQGHHTVIKAPLACTHIQRFGGHPGTATDLTRRPSVFRPCVGGRTWIWPNDRHPQRHDYPSPRRSSHRRFNINNKDYLYVLSTFVFEPVRWNERYGWRPMCASWDVPVHLITRDPEMLARFVALGFRPGLVPQRPALGGLHDLTGVLLQAFNAEPGVRAQQQGAPTPLARRP